MVGHSDEDADSIREAAAAWIARLHSDDRAPDSDAAFAEWLAADERHRLVYQRMARRFDNARVLKHAHHRPALWPARRRPSVITSVALLAAALVLIVVLTDFPMFHRSGRSGTEVAQNVPATLLRRHLAAPAAELRTVGLADGSTITLDRASSVAVDYSRDRRLLTLLSGRARFAVAHEPRPFVVIAGHGTVTAHGTLFDIALDRAGDAHVRLLRGFVDVTSSRSAGRRPMASRRMRPGDVVEIGSAGTLAPVKVAAASDDRAWVDGPGSFDNVALGDLIARANQNGAQPIRLADPSLAALRVSGRFGVDDPDRLAANLAALFDLHVARGDDGVVLGR